MTKLDLLLKLLNYKHRKFLNGNNTTYTVYFPVISNPVAILHTRASKPYFRVFLCGNDKIPQMHQTGLCGAYIKLRGHLREVNCPKV